jgi:ribose transport system permease protein
MRDTKMSLRPPGLGLDRYSGLYLFALFIVVFGFWTPDLFLTEATLHSIVSAQAVTGILALSALVPLAAGQYDLSIGANANLTAITAVVLLTDEKWSLLPSILCSLAVGVLVGLANGLVVVKLKINSFIATLGMTSILGATQVIVSDSTQPNPPTSTTWGNLTQTEVFGFPVVIVYLLVLAVIVWWLLDHTPAGRYLFALGGNPEAARLSGVRIERWTLFSFVVSGSIAGLAGVLYASFSGPSLTFGSALLLPAFAAAFLGSTQLKPGRVNTWGTLLAIYVLATGVQGLQFVSGQQWLNDMFNGVALLVAVGLAVNRRSSLRRPSTPDTRDTAPSSSAT